ncbi:MAG TPA: hypothetical protein VGD14_08070, partial [bacterium]
ALKDVLAVSSQNDPFNIGTRAQVKQAEWFQYLWEKFCYTNGIHLRRIHYQAVSEEILKPDGTVYQNTLEDWAFLGGTGRFARYLNYVDARCFVDRRNPDPKIYYAYEIPIDKPHWNTNSIFTHWNMPGIDTNLASEIDWELPTYNLYGYEYFEKLQPYHIEIWEEKSTMDDVLKPICSKYGIDLVTGLGYLSITSIMGLLDRIDRCKKPTLIFYISDFDPAGFHMPKQVARQIEFWMYKNKLELDVKLNPIVLTKEQMINYQLPRIPIKESDRRKKNFEETFGEGATELDALEALHPGELKKIIENQVAQYRDPKLHQKLRDAKSEAEKAMKESWETVENKYQPQLDEIKESTENILANYKEELEQLSDRLAEELQPHRENLESLWDDVTLEISKMKTELPEKPEPEINMSDKNYLFDSDRDYLQQLQVYKNYRDGNHSA